MYVLRDSLDMIFYACTDMRKLVHQASKYAHVPGVHVDFVKSVVGKK